MKKTIYILLSIFLGFLLSFILYALAEISYVKHALSSETYSGNILPLWTKYIFFALGMVGGYFLGQLWWRLVYVEKRHWRFRKGNQ